MSANFDPGRVEAILFDIDGTLADTDDVIVAKLAAGLKPLTRLWPALPAQGRWTPAAGKLPVLPSIRSGGRDPAPGFPRLSDSR